MKTAGRPRPRSAAGEFEIRSTPLDLEAKGLDGGLGVKLPGDHLGHGVSRPPRRTEAARRAGTGMRSLDRRGGEGRPVGGGRCARVTAGRRVSNGEAMRGDDPGIALASATSEPGEARLRSRGGPRNRTWRAVRRGDRCRCAYRNARVWPQPGPCAVERRGSRCLSRRLRAAGSRTHAGERERDAIVSARPPARTGRGGLLRAFGSGHAVANASLVHDVDGPGRVIAELSPQILYEVA